MTHILSNAFLSILFTFFCISYSYTQDVVHLKDGSMLDVKVTEITPSAVKYRARNNPDGPVYSIDRRQVRSIVYENGTSETFERTATPRPEKPIRERRAGEDYGRHFIGLNLADLFRTDITLHYEYLLKNNRIGFRIPVTVGFNNNYFNTDSKIENPYVFRRNRIFSIGLDARFYPGGQGKARYVVGPGLHYILNNKRGPLVGSVPVGNHPVSTMRIMVYNGVVFTPVPQFRFGFDMGLGTQYDFTDTEYTDERVFGDPKIQFNWYAGYKF
ncbi:MAG: hypothetical protein IBJ09_03355 [Bacteroidia bacterium]|nr:hypothetical protein [Bacteroidia bacterium]